jgi:N-acetylglucosaminyldiphosphoundecaprenol N-acetyl-beta-D-mannosaminyltransferase
MLRRGHSVLGTWVDALFWDDAIGHILNWGASRESRYVCICNVHSVVTATHDAELRSALGGADLSTSDGAPIAGTCLTRSGWAKKFFFTAARMTP